MNPHAMSEEHIREFAEPYGGIDALNRRVDLHRKAAARLSREWDNLIAEYPDHRVAMGADGVLATALSVDDLLSQLHATGKRDEPFAMRFLNTSTVPRFLSPLG